MCKPTTLVNFLLLGEVTSDLLDSISDFSYVDQNFGSPKPKELVFAADVSGFGLKLYYVEKTATKAKSVAVKTTPSVKFGTDVRKIVSISTKFDISF